MSNADRKRIKRDEFIQPIEGVVLRHVAGEHMLVPTITREVDLDRLFLLNETGVFVWERLDSRHSVQDLAREVEAEFGAPAATALRDVGEFLSRLVERGLVRRS